jgi:integrase
LGWPTHNMSVERVVRGGGQVVWRVRWREAGRNRSRVIGRKRDAEAFDAEVRRRLRLGEVGFAAGRETLHEYVTGTWAHVHARHLAQKTRQGYAWLYDRHIGPRLGGVPLTRLTPEVLARFQADLISAAVGHETRRKSMVLLGGILQRAAESRRIAYNPARLVRKAPVPARAEVRPLAPIVVERMRAAVDPRDATLISVLAYAGLRPQEVRGICWCHVRERTVLVHAPKTGRSRTVRLLAALAEDLRDWRRELGDPKPESPVFAGANGDAWTAEGFNKWRQRGFRAALDAAGVDAARPYDLRHSFASLLLHEGRSVIYVARQLGHGADLTMGTYGHVIEELEDAPRMPADEAIAAARKAVTEATGR